MTYSIRGSSSSKSKGSVTIKQSIIRFGVTSDSINSLANPAEIFLGSFAACILKNVERFSDLMKFSYSNAEIAVSAARTEKPPRMEHIEYTLVIYTDDTKLNVDLLKKNIEKFGTIFNTVKLSCDIKGSIKVAPALMI